MELRKGSGETMYKAGVAEVWEKLNNNICPEVKMKITRFDEQAGIMEGSTGLSVWSPGVKLTIQLTEKGDNNTHVAIKAQPKSSLTLIDYGHSNRTVQQIFQSLNTFFAAGEYSDSTEESEGMHCPSCQGTVHSGHAFCTHCGAEVGKDH